MWSFLKRKKDFRASSTILSAMKASSKEGAKKATEKISETFTTSLIGSLLIPTTGAIIGNVSGAVLSKFVESILKQADDTQALVKTLVDEPFKTGSRIIKESLRLPISNSEELQYRTNKLNSGVLKLEEAFSLTEDENTKIIISALLGLAALISPGGRASASLHFESTINLCQNEIIKLRERLEAIPRIEEKDVQHLRNMQKYDYERLMDHDKGFKMSIKSMADSKQREYEAYLKLKYPLETEIEALHTIIDFSSQFLIGQKKFGKRPFKK